MVSSAWAAPGTKFYNLIKYHPKMNKQHPMHSNNYGNFYFNGTLNHSLEYKNNWILALP